MGALLRLLGFALVIVCAVTLGLETDRSLPPLTPDAPAPAPAAPPVTPAPHVVRLFFGGGDAPHQVEGVLEGVTLDQLAPLGVPPERFVADASGIHFSFSSPGNDLVGFAVAVPTGPLHWALTLDGNPFPPSAFFAGPFGLPAPELIGGIGPSCLHGFATGSGTPYFSHSMVGAFVICTG